VAERTGRVWLVGAGPGDPGLITVRGLAALRRADVVVHDRLVAAALLAEARPDVLLVDAGKQPDAPSAAQEQITAALLEHARAGREVVRLKGGDPFVFGRGGEEAVALAEAGIAFEVVPGVTSATAVPAAAGIPVSHRDHASTIAVVAAHRAGERDLPWASLAGIDTVVVLMGASRVGEVCRRLLAAGRDPATPAAAIQWGTTDRQREVTASLAALPDAFTAAGLGAPSVIVIGDVVGLSAVIGGQVAALAGASGGQP
jgi:uroporphyrin-III C-methyltransferase